MTQFDQILYDVGKEGEKLKPKQAHTYVNSMLDQLLETHREDYWSHKDTVEQLRMDVDFRLQRAREIRRNNFLVAAFAASVIAATQIPYFNARPMTPNEKRDLAQAVSVFDDGRNKVVMSIEGRAINYKIAGRDDLAAIEFNKVRQIYGNLQAECPQTNTPPAIGCRDYYAKQIASMSHLPK